MHITSCYRKCLCTFENYISISLQFMLHTDNKICSKERSCIINHHIVCGINHNTCKLLSVSLYAWLTYYNRAIYDKEHSIFNIKNFIPNQVF